MSERLDKAIRKKAKEHARYEWRQFLDTLAGLSPETRLKVIMRQVEKMPLRERLNVAWRVARGV